MSTSHHQSCGRYALPGTRREFLARAGAGLGLCALADLLCEPARAADDEQRPGDPLAPRAPHFAPKATSVIWLFMEGAPSAVDLFDPKPELDKNHGKKMAIDVFNGNPGPLMKSPFAFRQYGESGPGFARSTRTSRGTSTTSRSSSRASPSRTITCPRSTR